MSNIIVMAFSPRNIVGCFLKKKGLQRGEGGHGHPRTPPRYALDLSAWLKLNNPSVASSMLNWAFWSVVL